LADPLDDEPHCRAVGPRDLDLVARAQFAQPEEDRRAALGVDMPEDHG
jgi:hypothetical protein